MKYRFSLVYDFDATVAAAVAAYLDAEHYVHLHGRYAENYEILEYDDLKMRARVSWKLGPLRASQSSFVQYIPPARFLQYGTRPDPVWLPSIHHLLDVRTDLRYYEDETRHRTVSHLDFEIDMPFWLWPFRKFIRSRLERLKIEKDEQDLAMIRRRERLFGRGNVKAYLASHQFMLCKEHFVEHFG